MHDWYLVHTKIRQERVALENLERQGFECYLPLIRVEKLLRGQLQEALEPLFPRYLFMRLGSSPQSQSWSPIRSTLGVSRLVTFGQTPAKIDDALIQQIQHSTDSNQVQRRVFSAGQSVLVTHGPFIGLEAIYQMADGEGRVMVLLNLLSKPVKLVLAPTHIRQIN